MPVVPGADNVSTGRGANVAGDSAPALSDPTGVVTE
jgi:hypothetical protein